MQPRSVGEILDAAFQLYRSHFVPLLLVAAVGVAPISLATSWLVLFEAGSAGDGSGAATAALGVVALLALIPLALVYGALAWAVARAAEGDAVRIGEAYRRAARTFPALFGAGIVAFIFIVMGFFGVFLGAVLVALPFAFLGGMAGDVGAAVGTVIGGLVAVAGGLATFAVLCGLFFAVLPLTVVDRKGPLSSIKRSFELSRGGRLKIVAVLFVAWLIILLPSMGISMIFLGPMATLDPTASANMPVTMLALQGIANFASSILTTPFLVACIVLLYYDRRVATEALDLERAVADLERDIEDLGTGA